MAALGLPALGLSAATPLFTRADISIPEAAPENLLQLSPHPSPNVFASPIRARIAAQRGETPARRQAGVGNETVNTIFSGVYPTVNLTWGSKTAGTPGQQFISFIDTGSADTWVVGNSLECVDITTREPLTQAACGFGPLYDSTVGSFTNITGDTFSISYFPEEESLKGQMGYAPITFGGLTVPKQEVALVSYAAWAGDGVSSGLLGLAYPRITSSSAGVYDPIFTTMIKDSIVTYGIFTLAINRVPQGTSVLADAGLMAVGGLVPSTYYDAPWTSVAIEKSGGVLEFYTISHSLVYRASTANATTEIQLAASTYESIVDSGTAPNFVPTAAANAINAEFDPPAVYNETLGYYVTDCNATAPYVAYVIGGVEMPMDPQDMIVRSLNGLPGYEDVCFSAFADGGLATAGNIFIIGAMWQRNYVVAYDQTKTMMHFATRKPY
jgi:hypothetical protein